MIHLRPSASHIWTRCAAYPRFAENVPAHRPSDAAREGTCAAWVAEMVLTGAVSTAADMIDMAHENGWLVDRDMTSFVQGYVDHLRARGGTIYTERFVRLNDMIGGTPDSFSVIDETGTLHVIDLKYGYDIVEPEWNTQVSIYTGAIWQQIGIAVKHIVIGIYQPRAIHPDGVYRTWEPPLKKLQGFINWIEERGRDCQDPQSIATPGHQCKNCPVAHTCPAALHTLYAGHDVITSPHQMNLTGKQLANKLDFVGVMEDVLKGVSNAIKAEATERLKQGQHVPGWGFEQRYGNKKFTVDADTIKALTGIDPADGKLCTPAELIRRAGGKKTVKDTVDRITKRPSIAPKLVKQEIGKFFKH